MRYAGFAMLDTWFPRLPGSYPITRTLGWEPKPGHRRLTVHAVLLLSRSTGIGER